MADTLTQEEIDALREAVRSGQPLPGQEAAPEESPGEAVRVMEYDFLKPRLISSANHRLLQLSHEALAKNLQTALFNLLKVPVELKLVAMDQITYGEFILSLGNPTYLMRLATTPNVGSLAMEMNTPILLAMADLLLGGEGAAPAQTREPTALELGIIEPVAALCLAQLKIAWSSVGDLTFTKAEYEPNPEYLRMAPPETACLETVFDVHMGSVSGVINICYPLTVIQGVFQGMDERKRAAAPDSSAGRGQEMMRALSPVPLRVHALLGSATVYARDLASLQAGDILCLEKRIDTPVMVAVDQSLMFTAAMGKHRGKLAVRLLGARDVPVGAKPPPPGPKK